MYPPNNDENFHLAGNILSRFKGISTFIFDVDGVLTNGDLLITEQGELLRKMNVRDGFALKRAVEEGYHVFILTAGKSAGVIDRLRGLGIRDIVFGTQNKLQAYEEFLDAYDLNEDTVLYMGDDIPDFEVMRRVGLPTCPSDAVTEIREISHYISPLKGGEGCARDVIEKVLKLSGNWR